ncbi:transcription antitermination factor NusB [bacterium]|nr:MAG: transcription antitermination factor NusB [bacterium]
MRKRTQAREYALQLLYAYDITQDELKDLEPFWAQADEVIPEIKDFTEKLFLGTLKNLERIDKKISGFADNWQLKRMAAVDRNILRMGSFELSYLEDVPAKVTINEAVDLAKKYSGEEAGKFVNGILDRIRADLGKN